MAVTNRNIVKRFYPDAREVNQHGMVRIMSDEVNRFISAWFFEAKDAWKHAAKDLKKFY